MKSFLKVPLAIGFSAAMTYGGLFGSVKLTAYTSSGKRPYGIIAEDVTLGLKRVYYSVQGGECIINEMEFFTLTSLDMTDAGCNGTVDMIRTRNSRVERDSSNEVVFKKADKKFSKLVKEYRLDERVKGYMDDSEDLEGYFPE